MICESSEKQFGRFEKKSIVSILDSEKKTRSGVVTKPTMHKLKNYDNQFFPEKTSISDTDQKTKTGRDANP